MTLLFNLLLGFIPTLILGASIAAGVEDDARGEHDGQDQKIATFPAGESRSGTRPLLLHGLTLERHAGDEEKTTIA